MKTTLITLALLAAVASPTQAQQSCNDIPAVLLVLDKSGSMLGDIGAQSKWDVAVAAIEATLTQFSDTVSFGLAVFPSADNLNYCDTNRDDLKILVAPAKAPNPPIGAQTIKDALTAPEIFPFGRTPLIKTIRWTYDYLKKPENSYGSQPLAVVLITDGKESCNCSVEEPEICHDTGAEKTFINEELRNATSKLLLDPSLKVRTYVVSFSADASDVNVAQLNTIAIHGGTFTNPACLDPNANLDVAQCYYLATSASSLEAVLKQIAGDITQNEVCDGKDNNCDGKIDEGFDVGAPCVGQHGVCQIAGKKECAPDGLATRCSVDPGGSESPQTSEKCDGLDNDCDGQVDEDFALKGQPCSVQILDQCPANGTWVCKADGSGLECNATTPGNPSPEVCDGLDNDCNGKIDDGFEGQELTCLAGTACEFKVPVCKDGKPGTCEPAPNGLVEICDGEDNDCDGVIDDFSEDCSAACGKGKRTCTMGTWGECVCEPTTECGDTCKNGEVCACGGCQKLAINGECATGTLVGYLCVVDKCSNGKQCDFGTATCTGPSGPGADADVSDPDLSTTADGVTPDTIVTSDAATADGSPPADADLQLPDDGVAPGDASTNGDGSAGQDGTGVADGGKTSSGCGCRQPNTDPTGAPLWPLALLFGLLIGVRRMRRQE